MPEKASTPSASCHGHAYAYIHYKTERLFRHASISEYFHLAANLLVCLYFLLILWLRTQQNEVLKEMPNAKLLIPKITGTKSQLAKYLCYHQNLNFKNFMHPSGIDKPALDEL